MSTYSSMGRLVALPVKHGSEKYSHEKWESWEVLTLKAHTYLASLMYNPKIPPFPIPNISFPVFTQFEAEVSKYYQKFSVTIINNTGIRLVPL